MKNHITAQQIIERIKDRCGATWKESGTDIFNAGDPDTAVTGIVTSFTASAEVLQQAVTAGKNLLITQQPAFYGETKEYLKDDPAWVYKTNFIAKHGLVIWRFYDNWNARPVDGQLLGLTKALGWEKYHIYEPITSEQYAGVRPEPRPQPYAAKNKYFQLPESSLRDKITEIGTRLNIKGIRVIGDPVTTIRKAALSHGMFRFTELQEILKDPAVDLLVLAEAIEWESPEYFRDMLTWKGKNKAMILLGREASEDPGYAEVASWLKTFIPEVPVAWISANEPFWIP